MHLDADANVLLNPLPAARAPMETSTCVEPPIDGELIEVRYLDGITYRQQFGRLHSLVHSAQYSNAETETSRLLGNES